MRGPSITLIFAFPLLTPALHAVLSRTRLPRQPAALLAGLVAAAAVFTGLAIVERRWGEWIPFSLLLLGAGAHVYFHFFNMSETARRIRRLMDLREERPAQAAPDWERTIALRLARLEEWREVRRDGNRYHPTPRWLTAVARCLVGYERLLFPERFRRPESPRETAAAERAPDPAPSPPPR